MSRHRSSTTTILLLTTLAVGALSACGGSTPATGTSPVTSRSTANSTQPPPGSSPATPVSPDGNKAIPQLAGDKVSVAELYLQQVGLRTGRMLPESNTIFQSGLVITTSPYAGDVVPYGSAVDLLVSDGYPGCPPGTTCSATTPGGGFSVTMPDVIGQTVAQATTTLALDGITLGSSVVEASSAPSGTVICTVPAAGESFQPTTPVAVGVSSGDPGSPPATLCGASTTPPPTSPTGPQSTSPTGPTPISPAEPTSSGPASSPVQPSVSSLPANSGWPGPADPRR